MLAFVSRYESRQGAGAIQWRDHMKKFAALAIAALVTAGLSAPAFAGSCPKDMKAIDAALSKMPNKKTPEIASLRARGEAQHKSGDHKGSVKTLHQAMVMLGIAK